MQRIIIADTSCLILLEKINELDLLRQLFGSVIITSVIAKEFGIPLPDWIHIDDPQNINYQNILSTNLDAGEASAIALAIEQDESLLIIDDNKARKLATELKLNYTGTIGILISAYNNRYIVSMEEIVNKLKLTNFYITPELEAKLLGRY